MEICCELCLEELHDGQACYGITMGKIDIELGGFAPDMDTPWSLVCLPCYEALGEPIS